MDRKIASCDAVFAEYSSSSKCTVLTVVLVSCHNDCKVSVIEPNIVQVESADGVRLVELVGLTIRPLSCTNLKSLSPQYMCGTFSSTFSAGPHPSEKPIQKLCNLITEGQSLLCRFCQNQLADLSPVKDVQPLSKLLQLEDFSLPFDIGYFCHAKHPHGNKPIKFYLISNKHEALANEAELLFHPSIWNAKAFKTNKNRIFCSRCLLTLGQIVKIKEVDHHMVWTSCLTVVLEERDIDGDFLRHVERPLLAEEAMFYAAFVSHLLQKQHYRVIVSATSWDGCNDFMLLWLFGQEVRLFYTALANNTHGTDSHGDSLGEQVGGKPRTPKATPSEPITGRRVLYRILFPLDAQCDSESNELLSNWRKDFGVTQINLPLETCIGLAVCLNQFNSRMAPHLRRPEGPMSAFLCGAVPDIPTEDKQPSSPNT